MADSNPPGNGKQKELFSVLQVQRFVNARASEMNSIKNLLQNTTSGHMRVFQTLPRHLRRRTASYNTHRLPIRLRLAAMREAQKDLENNAPRKIPQSRRRRRRSGLLLTDFLRRQRKNKWLETHIWHTKRMKIGERWGYKLALHPSDKGTRAAYKMATHSATLHDASYTECIQVMGTLQDLKKVFAEIADPTRPAPTAARFLDGSRYGVTHLYEGKKYPYGFICESNFLWRPEDDHSEEPVKEGEEGMEVDPPKEPLRTIWFWIHPAAISQAKQTFDRVITENKLAGVAATILAAELLKFELCGPRAHDILVNVLKVSNQGKDAQSARIWQALKGLRTPSSLTKGAVLALSVYDPRLSFAGRKMPPRPKNTKTDKDLQDILTSWPSGATQSKIWDPEHRLDLKNNKAKDYTIDLRRKNNPVKGPLNPLPTDARVPILLMRRPVLEESKPGTSPRDFGAGWDIIVPAGWGVTFWKSLVFSGARVFGLREQHSACFEASRPWFPADFPDSDACKVYAHARAGESEATYNKKPQAKRPNFKKLGISSPFQPPWESLLAPQEAASSKNFWVVRGEQSTTLLSKLLMIAPTFEKLSTDYKAALAANPKFLSDVEVDMEEAFVLVSVHLLGRGTLAPNGPLYQAPEEHATYWKDKLKKVKSGALDLEPEGELKLTPPSASAILGFTTTGHFSYALGKPGAIACCHLRRLFDLVQENKSKHSPKTLALVRKPTSLHFWPATLEILS